MIKINYSNGKSWTLKGDYYVDGWVDWDDESLGIKLNSSFLEDCAMYGCHSPSYESDKLVYKDVTSIEDHCHDSIVIWKNPNYKLSVQVDIKTAKQRCELNNNQNTQKKKRKEKKKLAIWKGPTKAILLNGPAGCGKDSAIQYLIDNLGYKLERKECKDSLHKLTMELFRVPPDIYWGLYGNRETKEIPSPCYNIDIEKLDDLLWIVGREFDAGEDNKIEGNGWIVGANYSEIWLSPRNALIYVSECVLKPLFGKDCFGRARAESVNAINQIIVDGSAAAFEEDSVAVDYETAPLVEKLGKDNVLVIKVTRDGCSFTGDSRRYLPETDKSGIHVVVSNSGSEEDYNAKVLEIVKYFLDV